MTLVPFSLSSSLDGHVPLIFAGGEEGSGFGLSWVGLFVALFNFFQV